jgi:phage tail-like protein
MDAQDGQNFYYLNRDGHWPDFDHRGLQIQPDGAWQLASVPLLLDDLPDAVVVAPAPDAPAGLAYAEGTVYFSRPGEQAVWRIDGCDTGGVTPPVRRPLPCFGGEGRLPTQLRQPRGLLFHPIRRALFVADSGNHRLQIFDVNTLQLLDIWGQPDLAGEPAPDEAPGRFNQPWSLAADAKGSVYVVDYGNRRVQKFDLRGQADPRFWERAQADTDWGQPAAVAAAVTSADGALWLPRPARGDERDRTRVFVLDVEKRRVTVLTGDGRYLAHFGESELQAPLALSITDEAIYIGDNGRRRVLKFKRDPGFTYVGPAHGYEGPVAALAPDSAGHLWVHPGGNAAPMCLGIAQAVVKSGVFWGGPFGDGVRPVTWHRLKAIGPALPDNSHAQLFVYTSDEVSAAPGEPDIQAARPFNQGGWKPLPPDVLDGLVMTPRARYLWVGAHLTGEGHQSPVIQQMRVDYDHITYRQYLPAIFGKDAVQRELLDQLLSLFESFYGDAEEVITHLSRYFDPEAVPAEWLPWLASWLALDLDENWSEAQQRATIASAIRIYDERGTAAGLRRALRDFAGIDAHIEEPVRGAGWWALANGQGAEPTAQAVSILGFTTRLAPGQPEGAVLGGSATLDRSYLIDAAAYGAPLFENVAHQFTVQVYRGQVSRDGALHRVQAVVEREKPAHTAYHLCVIEPRMRVGFQARLGIDTVVAGPAQPTALDGSTEAEGLVLGGDPAGRMGVDSQVGHSTRLTSGSAS